MAAMAACSATFAIFFKYGSGKYQTIKGEALVGINSNSVLAKYPSGRPVHWILFHELQCNNEDIPECYDVSWIASGLYIV